MWVPKTTDELERLVPTGAIEESSTLDFKATVTQKNEDIATDIAAMANDGGVLIYGVGEDKNKRPTVLNPIPLAGHAERISAIARSGISEPPQIQISTLPKEEDASVGYIVVLVPASERAPHMVTSGKNNRFYGRGAKENIPLNEGEVARLYERRTRWEVDREGLLTKLISEAPLRPDPDFGFLHLLARPVGTDLNLLKRAAKAKPEREFLWQLIEDVRQSDALVQKSSAGFGPGDAVPIDRGWRVFMFGKPDSRRDQAPRECLELEAHFDGQVQLFWGACGERVDGRMQLWEHGIAPMCVGVLRVASELCSRASYSGPLDVCVALTGVLGASSRGMGPRSRSRQLGQLETDRYTRTTRVLASEANSDPNTVGKLLLADLLHTLTLGLLDPFR